MKSNQESLASRGYIPERLECNYTGLNFDEKIRLLQSQLPTDRTLGARLLSKETNCVLVVQYLIKALKTEKKLYPKIEICNTLTTCGIYAVESLIEQLGKIGGNQYKSVPQEKFNKTSYPLPRDIASRTLAHIGINALSQLLNILNENDQAPLSEAIDAIGYICFYQYTDGVFEKLRVCFIRNIHSELIRWKIIRAMSGFPESQSFLLEQSLREQNEGIKLEIHRSLFLIQLKNSL